MSKSFWRLATIPLAAILPFFEADAQTLGDMNTPAQFIVTDTVLRPAEKIPPLGANNWGGCGAIEWAANNFVQNSGNEPIYWRDLFRVSKTGTNWFEPEGPGTSWYDLWDSGLLSGAEIRIYRLVTAENQPVPLNEKGTEIMPEKADHVQFVGEGKILPEGSPGFPDGGWVVGRYSPVNPCSSVKHGNLSAVDVHPLPAGRTYWYTVVAVNGANVESDVGGEAKAVTQERDEVPPHILPKDDADPVPPLKTGTPYNFTPRVAGGVRPLVWAVVDENGGPIALPAGLKIDSTTGAITGNTGDAVEDLRIFLSVTDANGKSDRRAFVFNAKKKDASDKSKPEPPTDIKAEAGPGFVKITWKPSPSANVVSYRLKRSTMPLAEQVNRVYVTEGTPKILPFDQIVVRRKFDHFDMKYANPRIRGLANPMTTPKWFWDTNLDTNSVSIVPHPKPIPAEMIDPGESCLQVKAGAGEQKISQLTMIGIRHRAEARWYGQLEPGKNYRLEVWLRQEGLGANGSIEFSFGNPYPEIKAAFPATNEWKKFTYDFTGPERPVTPLHFGQQFKFVGPGTVWMDNCRIFRIDSPGDAEKPFAPNATIMNELVASQPERGRKGAHRMWFLDRHAEMSNILGWHCNSNVSVNWISSVAASLKMTLPEALTAELKTGPDAASRMRPWLVIQHILHSEKDWQNFIEYLAAPYDPSKDTPASKPWAFKRFQQRGVGTPWTDEFPEIIVEFGNETWHNGVFPDWIGFAGYHKVHQGGREYGLFTRYLVENMMKSPYWKEHNLDKKLRFTLGGNYNGDVSPNGTIAGYGEQAMLANPYAQLLSHANYVGPKWETGEYSARNFDDTGIQRTLLSFLGPQEKNQTKMMNAREAMAKKLHEYDITAYEGGPGGYALPGSGATPEQIEANENYGKSLAQAVGAFDCWMRSYKLGWTHQCFYGFAQGSNWSSHTPLWDDFRPHAAWLAMILRNRYATGDLVDVTDDILPTVGIKGVPYPLIGVYAMKENDRWSLFVVSRKLDGNHDDQDFGDGYNKVSIKLPFKSASKITLHKLVGNPRENNRNSMVIALKDEQIPVTAIAGGKLEVNQQTGGGPNGMPPGQIFLYAIEGAKK